MASAIEILFGIIGLLVYNAIIITLYFVFDVTFGPVLNFAGQYFAAHPPPIDVSGMTMVPSAILGVLICLDIVAIIAFVAIIFRREDVGTYDYGGGGIA